MRAKSFSAEKRKRQDTQASIAFIVLATIVGIGFLWDLAMPYCKGGLQGVWAPLLILTLRYGYRVLVGRRMDLWGIIDAVTFLGTLIAVSVTLYPTDVWHAVIMLLCLISTVIGIQRFRFTPLFMFFNCLIAGLILL